MNDPTTAIAAPDPRAETAAQLADERKHWHGFSLQAWFLKCVDECKTVRARIKEQCAAMLRQVDHREEALHWRFGREFRQLVEADLEAQKGTRKSVKYPTGTAGFRSTRGRLQITDAVALKDWCSEHLPEGLKLELSASAISEYIKRTADIPPGCEWVDAVPRFYPSIENPQLEEVSDVE